MSGMEWISGNCRLLAETTAEFAKTRPFDGLRIGAAIHLEPKTAALLMTLARGGAEVVATGNLQSTQLTTVAYLRARGIEVVGEGTSDPAEQAGCLEQVLGSRPDLLLDNGGDLFVHYLDAPYEQLLGGTEETTSGRTRLAPLHARIARPVLVINDSPIKQFAENFHAVGQSVLESFLRITNRATNGRRVTVVGYGPCGRGIALNFRNAHALVSVLETDPVKRLRALLDGFAVPDRDEAVASAQIIVTATGASRILTGADLQYLSDGVVLANAGHVPWEIDVPSLLGHPDVLARYEPTEGVTSLTLADGRTVHVLAEGHMVNLAGPRPLGNSAESMDLGFTLQARCLEAIATGQVPPDLGVAPVPAELNVKVADAYVRLARL